MELQLINGHSGQLPLDHRALAYGDGLFETILSSNGQLQFFDEHMQRLLKGVDRIALNWSKKQQIQLTEMVTRLVADLVEPHVVKVMLLRNYPGRGYFYDKQDQTVDCIVQVKPYVKPAWTSTGANVLASQLPISENASLAGLKHLNRLDSVIARASVSDLTINEVLMLTSAGIVVSGSMSNVFFLNKQKWETPCITSAGVAGIIRSKLLDEFPEFSEGNITESIMATCSAAFITNSLIGVVPIISLNGRALDSHLDILRFSHGLNIAC